MYDQEMERAKMRLPKDWHVPPSLRAHRERSKEEIIKDEMAADTFLFNQSRRVVRRRRHD